MLALGYCFARRRSELVGLDFERVGTGTGFLTLTRTTLEVHLHSSKRSGGTNEVYAVPRAQNELAVEAIERWLRCADVQPGEPILRRVYRSGRVAADRLDAQSVALIVKRRLTEFLIEQGRTPQAAAREADHYAGHSLRVGFAVTAAEAGATVLAIQKALGHAGPAMAARYAQAAEHARLSPHHLAGVSLGAKRRRRKVGEPG